MAESVFESPVLRRALVRHQSRHEALLGWLFGRLLVTECALRHWSRDDERRDAECTRVLRGNGYEVDRAILEVLEGSDKAKRDSVGPCLTLAHEGALVMMSRQGIRNGSGSMGTAISRRVSGLEAKSAAKPDLQDDSAIAFTDEVSAGLTRLALGHTHFATKGVADPSFQDNT